MALGYFIINFHLILKFSMRFGYADKFIPQNRVPDNYSDKNLYQVSVIQIPSSRLDIYRSNTFETFVIMTVFLVITFLIQHLFNLYFN
jgi:hypothetical protein